MLDFEVNTCFFFFKWLSGYRVDFYVVGNGGNEHDCGFSGQVIDWV